MAKESEERREAGGDDMGRKVEWEGKWESETYRERQKLNKLNWRPCFKQRGLFSDRDPSQEVELENRLIELSKLLSDIAQHVPQRYVNKSCCALHCAGLWRGWVWCSLAMPLYSDSDGPSGGARGLAETFQIFHVRALWRRGVSDWVVLFASS